MLSHPLAITIVSTNCRSFAFPFWVYFVRTNDLRVKKLSKLQQVGKVVLVRDGFHRSRENWNFVLKYSYFINNTLLYRKWQGLYSAGDFFSITLSPRDGGSCTQPLSKLLTCQSKTPTEPKFSLIVPLRDQRLFLKLSKCSILIISSLNCLQICLLC